MRFYNLAAFVLLGAMLVGCTDEKVVLPDVTDVPTASAEGAGTRPYDNSWEMPDEMPIIAWLGVPSGFTTKEQYTLLKDCGFNVNYHTYSNEDALVAALEMASETGIQLLPQFQSGFLEDPATYVPKYDDHPALFGYFIKDEPTYKENFAEYKGYIDGIKEAGGTKPCYINLVGWPTDYNCEHWGFSDQKDYIDACIDTFDPPMISFDIYPIRLVDGDSTYITPNWYKCMELYRETSIRTGKPFWAFVKSERNYLDDKPTLEKMRLMANVDLAYGSQAIQYYSYWQIGGNSGNDFDAPVNNGIINDTYYYVRTLNEEIREVEKYFYKGTVTKVVHVTTEYEDITIDYAPEGALVSLLTSPEGKNYIVVVNKSYRENMSLSRRGVTYSLEPGGMVLLDRD